MVKIIIEIKSKTFKIYSILIIFFFILLLIYELINNNHQSKFAKLL